MKISLITVSYNSEETIRDTFESVRAQNTKGFDLEYIHVDGLSKDSTMDISMEFDDVITKRISEKDSGIYNAMNKGIEIASGDVIGFLNSDDTFSSSNILYIISREFISRPSLDIVYGDINYVDSSERIKRRWITGERKEFRKGWHTAHPGFYAKSSLFDRLGGFNEEYRIAADFDLMLRFMDVNSTTAAYLQKVLVNMKLGGESNKNIKNIFKANREILKSFQSYGIRPRFLYTIRRWITKYSSKFYF